MGVAILGSSVRSITLLDIFNAIVFSGIAFFGLNIHIVIKPKKKVNKGLNGYEKKCLKYPTLMIYNKIEVNV